MSFAARISLPRWALALFVWVLALGAAPLRAQDFVFPWSQPARRAPEPAQPAPELAQPAPQPARILAAQVRAILARDGAKMIAAPRAVRDEWIAIGRDGEGQGRKYILDAASGEILSVVAIALPEKPKAREKADDLAPPGRPLPPPVHAPSGDDAAAQPPAAQPHAVPAAAASTAPKPDPADATLSPIRPKRPAGAPKVEPLPQY